MRARDLRASDADRDRVCERLRSAAADGRIDGDELDERIARALRARTYGELEATIADLPREPDARRRRGGRASTVPSRRRSAGVWAVGAVRANPCLLLFVVPVIAITGMMLLAATMMWSLVMVALLLAGGRARAPRGPWTYAAHRGPWAPPPRRF